MKTLLSALLAVVLSGAAAAGDEVVYDSLPMAPPVNYADAYSYGHGGGYAYSGELSGGCPTCYGGQYQGCPAGNGTQWGCCERPWTPNMHLWDGYCAEKARWHAWLQSVKHRLQSQSCGMCPCGQMCDQGCCSSCCEDSACGSCCQEPMSCGCGSISACGSSCSTLGCQIEECQSPCGRGSSCTAMDGYGAGSYSSPESVNSPSDEMPDDGYELEAPIPPAPQASSRLKTSPQKAVQSSATGPNVLLPPGPVDASSDAADQVRAGSDSAVEAPQPELESSR